MGEQSVGVVSAQMLAMGYAWGRQDAGDGAKDTEESTRFAEAYAARQQAYNAGENGVGFMPNVQSAFETWRRTGMVVCP